ncbi:unknown [Roseburia sp. CAG:471]|nr:unknown [Roseburia sp. CAG:471]
MREKAKQRNPVDIIINVMTLVGLFFNVDMIN